MYNTPTLKQIKKMQQKLKLTRAWDIEREQSIDDENIDAHIISDAECEIETELWKPINPRIDTKFSYTIVDGTEKTHGAFITDINNEECNVILGSIVVGAVEITPQEASILENDVAPIIRRYKIQFTPKNAKDPVENLSMQIGNSSLMFQGIKQSQSKKSANLNSVRNLMDNLTSLMSKEELKLANSLADSNKMIFLDGPISQPKNTKNNIIGYIKGMRQLYLSPNKLTILEELNEGSRTPIFRIPHDTYGNKLSWFVCIKQFDNDIYDYKAGLMRFEMSEAQISIKQAMNFADATCVIFPSIAPEPFKDSRAPHNPIPVGELEKRMKHLIGDKHIIHRGIRNYIYETKDS